MQCSADRSGQCQTSAHYQFTVHTASYSAECNNMHCTMFKNEMRDIMGTTNSFIFFQTTVLIKIKFYLFYQK